MESWKEKLKIKNQELMRNKIKDMLNLLGSEFKAFKLFKFGIFFHHYWEVIFGLRPEFFLAKIIKHLEFG